VREQVLLESVGKRRVIPSRRSNTKRVLRIGHDARRIIFVKYVHARLYKNARTVKTITRARARVHFRYRIHYELRIRLKETRARDENRKGPHRCAGTYISYTRAYAHEQTNLKSIRATRGVLFRIVYNAVVVVFSSFFFLVARELFSSYTSVYVSTELSSRTERDARTGTSGKRI